MYSWQTFHTKDLIPSFVKITHRCQDLMWVYTYNHFTFWCSFWMCMETVCNFLLVWNLLFDSVSESLEYDWWSCAYLQRTFKGCHQCSPTPRILILSIDIFFGWDCKDVVFGHNGGNIQVWMMDPVATICGSHSGSARQGNAALRPWGALPRVICSTDKIVLLVPTSQCFVHFKAYQDQTRFPRVRWAVWRILIGRFEC